MKRVAATLAAALALGACSDVETCTTHTPRGELWSVRRYRAGLPDDPWVVWYANTIVQHERYYASGARTGTWASYAPNGQLLFERGYEDDAPHGRWRRWYPDAIERGEQGATPREEGAFERGRKVGTWRAWHPNGQLADESEWLQGELVRSLRYDARGELVERYGPSH